MISHWQQKDHWFQQGNESTQIFNEIWDGERFFELKWFWNPEEQWLLPAMCPRRTEVISANVIASFIIQREEQETLQIKCPYCFTYFEHSPRGDPRNIALIGHWDGWSPFSTSAKHSCGMKN